MGGDSIGRALKGDNAIMTESVGATTYRCTIPGGACLTFDETAAVVRVPAELSGPLYAYFRACGVPCSLSRQPGGRDVIDLGNPSPNEEKHIRTLFVAWKTGGAVPGEAAGRSVSWAVWVALVVTALWLMALFVL
jgi:hypothetical protein